MTKCMTDGIETISHRVDRLTIRIDDSFDDFRNRYERAVPEFQADRFESLIEKGADWDRVVAATAENAPHDCIVYWSRDFTSLMGLMGDQGCPASVARLNPVYGCGAGSRRPSWSTRRGGSARSSRR